MHALQLSSAINFPELNKDILEKKLLFFLDLLK